MAETIESFVLFAEEKLNYHLAALTESQSNNPQATKELNAIYQAHKQEFSRELTEKMITLSGHLSAESYSNLKNIKQEYENKLYFNEGDSTQNQKIRNFL